MTTKLGGGEFFAFFPAIAEILWIYKSEKVFTTFSEGEGYNLTIVQ